MSFTSLSFPIFAAAAVAVYYLVPKRMQWGVLLIASLAFYCTGGGLSVGYVLYTAATVYAAARFLGRFQAEKAASPAERKKEAAAVCRRRSRLVCLAVILLNFGLLYFLKYWNFTAGLIQPLAERVFHGARVPLSRLLLPLGVSFFMFQSAGYVIDVYRGKYPPEKSFGKFLLFVSFFPQMVQGPISRYNDLASQLFAHRDLDHTDLKYGIQLAMWGYFKKLVIADRAAVLVSAVLDDPWSYGGMVQAAGVLFYCIQLYGDFSGGIDIARGAARLFGIELAENFRRPIFAASLTDFWRRWHITLGTWMRDYLFYPLSLSKPFGRLGRFARRHISGKLGRILPTSLATFIVYFVIGIWHGANFRYVAFGFWNGGWITLSLLLEEPLTRARTALHINDGALWYRLFRVLRTNLIVFLGRYMTRAPRLLTAVWMMKQALVHPRFAELADGTLMALGLGGLDFAVIALGMAVVLAAERYQEKGGCVRAALEKKSFAVQWLAIAAPLVVLLCLGVMRGDYISSDFIYKQF